MGIIPGYEQLRSWLDSMNHRFRPGLTYRSLNGSENTPSRTSVRRYLSSGRVKLGIVALLVTTVLTALAVNVSDSIAFTPAASSAQEHIARYLHLLVPADHSDVNLCKTILSAAVHDYPTPILINWNATFDDPALVDGGSHVGKIKGVLDYLKVLGPERNHDLVILVDGYDVWFQVRPDVLIQRYYELNARAEARLRNELGKAMELGHITQTIIFSAQKKCWPHTEDETACFAVPESSLPKDVYGPDTDTDAGAYPFIKYRQRYLNSGDAMGPVGDMRALFERAFEKAQKDPNMGSDQSIISEIFGDQEYEREVTRQLHLSRLQRLRNWALGRKSFVDKHLIPNLLENVAGNPYEFHIGLDHESSLGQATVFAEEDLEWLRFNETYHLSSVYEEHGITHPGVTTLPNDIQHSPPPFWSVDGKERLPTTLSWKELPFYTNLWTGIVPGLLHHNAHRDGLKSRRETFWDKTWFQPYARALLSAHVKKPLAPLAVSRDRKGTEVAWWSPVEQKGGGNSDQDGRFLSWQSLCGETHEEIFRDGQGPWQDPR